MKPLLILPFSLAFLISCETTGPSSFEGKSDQALVASKPVAADMARIRLVAQVERKNGMGSNTSPYIFFYSYNDVQCTDEETLTTIRSGGYWGSKKSRLGMPLWDFDDQTAKEFEVEAGLFRSLVRGRDMMSGGLKYSCGVLVEEQLVAGSDYEMIFEWDDPKTCRVKFNQISGDTETATRRQMSMKTNVIDGPSSCEQQFRKNRWGN